MLERVELKSKGIKGGNGERAVINGYVAAHANIALAAPTTPSTAASDDILLTETIPALKTRSPNLPDPNFKR
jgi:hypothetical protein